MNVIQVPRLPRRQATPIIALIDLQREFVSDGRAQYLEHAEGAVSNCAHLLHRARELRLPIGHFRQIQNGHFFNRASEFSHWIDIVKPRPNEYIYERSQPSCFSNQPFVDLMRNIEWPEVILVGLGAERSCLSTAIDGFHRGCQITYIDDCSASAAVINDSEFETHSAVRDLISIYGEVTTIGHILRRLECHSFARSGS
jgi:nicotinamidase-related amidase